MNGAISREGEQYRPKRGYAMPTRYAFEIVFTLDGIADPVTGDEYELGGSTATMHVVAEDVRRAITAGNRAFNAWLHAIECEVDDDVGPRLFRERVTKCERVIEIDHVLHGLADDHVGDRVIDAEEVRDEVQP